MLIHVAPAHSLATYGAQVFLNTCRVQSLSKGVDVKVCVTGDESLASMFIIC